MVRRRPLGEVALSYINGELFCKEDVENLRAYGLIGAACKRQMELALYAMSHKERDIDEFLGELSKMLKRSEPTANKANKHEFIGYRTEPREKRNLY